MQNHGDNKKIAKNTVYLYIRTIAILLVSLYTSRVVLEVLGIENFGIYNVVAGIIALMGFFQAAQSKSTSRFITFELGSNGIGKSLQNVFRAAMTIHILAALAGIVICETIGLYVVTEWTSIPESKHFEAHIVYQFAILTFCVHLIRIPYDSIVIAHEEMSVFAYFSIIEVVLQLGLVFLVKCFPANALVVYAGLMCLSAAIMLLIYYIYVRRKFDVYRFRFFWEKRISRRMISFSGWTLLGAGTNAGTQQGVNLLMNNFVGLVANAAMGVAGQVNVAVSKFVNGFSTAFTPQIIKLYAQKEFKDMNLLITRSSKFSFILCMIFVVPLLFNMDFILHVWLGDNVPEYAAGFCSMILICTLFDATSGVYNTAITATGKIKTYQILISISFCVDLGLSALLLYEKIDPVLVFSSRILTRGLINMIIGLIFINRYTGFSVTSYMKTLLSMLLSAVITLPAVYAVESFTTGWGRLFMTTGVSCIMLMLTTYLIVMTKQERGTIGNVIKKKLHLK